MAGNNLLWSAAPIQDICVYKYLPSITNILDHFVLYKLPWNKDAVQPPVPQEGELKWGCFHVLLPCSSKNRFKALPYADNTVVYIEAWHLIESKLRQSINCSRDLQIAIFSYNPKYTQEFQGLHDFFDYKLNQSERLTFFRDTLPAMIDLALRLPELVTCAIPLLRSRERKTISMTQQQVACLLANAFLCTLPHRDPDSFMPGHVNYPSINFTELFTLNDNRALEKIKCIYSYFTSVCKEVPLGVITFTRSHKDLEDLPNWSRCDRYLIPSILHILDDNAEQNDVGLLQVDFAEKMVGGDAFGLDCSLDDVRFFIYPELLITRLFTQKLGPLDCLVVNGCEKFNTCSGYSETFKWEGAYTDKTPFDDSGRRNFCIALSDHINYHSTTSQYKAKNILNDLHRAFVGFCHEINALRVTIGVWKSGSCENDKCLKALLQMMVCCTLNRPLVYYTSCIHQLPDNLYNFLQYLSENEVTVCTVWKYLRCIREANLLGDNLYSYIIRYHENDRIVAANRLANLIIPVLDVLPPTISNSANDDDAIIISSDEDDEKEDLIAESGSATVFTHVVVVRNGVARRHAFAMRQTQNSNELLKQVMETASKKHPDPL